MTTANTAAFKIKYLIEKLNALSLVLKIHIIVFVDLNCDQFMFDCLL